MTAPEIAPQRACPEKRPQFMPRHSLPMKLPIEFQSQPLAQGDPTPFHIAAPVFRYRRFIPHSCSVGSDSSATSCSAEFPSAGSTAAPSAWVCGFTSYSAGAGPYMSGDSGSHPAANPNSDKQKIQIRLIGFVFSGSHWQPAQRQRRNTKPKIRNFPEISSIGLPETFALPPRDENCE